jgi:hypothetical protein
LDDTTAQYKYEMKNKIILLISIFIIFGFLLFYIQMIETFKPPDDADHIIVNYIKAIYKNNNAYISKYSDYKIDDFIWKNKIENKFKLYKDVGPPFYTEYWVYFKNNFVLYINFNEKPKKINRIEPETRIKNLNYDLLDKNYKEYYIKE